MEFNDWKPFYDAIRNDLDLSFERDQDVAELLDRRLTSTFDTGRLEGLLSGQKAWVAGNGPSLPSDIASIPDNAVVIAADAASRQLADAGIATDMVCTDLDGAPEHVAELSRRGALVAVHAHGDNRALIDQWIDRFQHRNVLGTTQTRPFGDLHNFGGFTDGDRSAFLADEFGAEEINFIGFDFDDPKVSEEKSRKLTWARRLLRYLSEQRAERFV